MDETIAANRTMSRPDRARMISRWVIGAGAAVAAVKRRPPRVLLEEGRGVVGARRPETGRRTVVNAASLT
ncbi:hypothetical protein GALLR39Z86_23720 [Glycomyces algeriensis]|uniref:Uncharacterized protein n=1 Tax=Glycomyces algeriensis TaxID=256037 RepID=A0A9W6LG20_9ACTN|nr:hypothetical protein GALLR39Z86_23720 [Glycomyces algeriensis]